MSAEQKHAVPARADESQPPLDVVVIGGSQTGLAVGHYLQRAGLRFVILEAGPDSGHVWRSRWDSLTLFTPRSYSGLPGMPFPSAGDSYPSKDDTARYLEQYALAFDLPIRYESRVTSLTEGDTGYTVATERDRVIARQVIVATGPFQQPYVPPLGAAADPGLVQLHSSAYRSPDQLPNGTVVVVGGGNSGFQIAKELAATRRVELSIGKRMVALPQRLLGRDLFWWLTRLGLIGRNVETRMGRRMSQRDFLIGSSRVDARRAGVNLRPRLERIDGRRAVFADGTDLTIDAVIWSTGYRLDYPWMNVSRVLDEHGTPLHRRGVTAAPGLYFLGLSWQYTRGSALIGFVQEDARFIAGAVEAFAGQASTGIPTTAGRRAA